MKAIFSIILVLLCITITFSQTKKKQVATSTTKSCHYCGKKFSKANGYVVPLGSPEGGSYKRQMGDISLVKRYSNYPKENLRLLEAGIKNGTYFCSRKCLYAEGYSVLE